jgi:hypothetical protein
MGKTIYGGRPERVQILRWSAANRVPVALVQGTEFIAIQAQSRGSSRSLSLTGNGTCLQYVQGGCGPAISADLQATSPIRLTRSQRRRLGSANT